MTPGPPGNSAFETSSERPSGLPVLETPVSEVRIGGRCYTGLFGSLVSTKGPWKELEGCAAFLIKAWVVLFRQNGQDGLARQNPGDTLEFGILLGFVRPRSVTRSI